MCLGAFDIKYRYCHLFFYIVCICIEKRLEMFFSIPHAFLQELTIIIIAKKWNMVFTYFFEKKMCFLFLFFILLETKESFTNFRGKNQTKA